ncbi:MAG: ATP-binding protein [Leptospirales bacterium]
MLNISSIDDIVALRESFELEYKLAAGKDGKGELPKTFWETYSAFANTAGGYIVLGLRENNETFQMEPIEIKNKMGGDEINTSSGHKDSSSGHKESSSGYKEFEDTHEYSERSKEGYLISSSLKFGIVDNLAELTKEIAQSMQVIAQPAKDKPRLLKPEMEKIIADLCQGRYITLQVLSELLNRNNDSLRKQYLTIMEKDGSLKLAFPTTPTHPKQAYINAFKPKRKK